ncbi:hypothetical protein BJQ90_01843 [Arthrobacter sp. SO3]|nr:hypothetical protein [Arthrobacter sp. SO3]
MPLLTQASTPEPAATRPSGETNKSAGPGPDSEVPPMSPKREPRFWTRENAPLIILGIGLILALIAAGIVLWIINVAPVISRLPGS